MHDRQERNEHEGLQKDIETQPRVLCGHGGTVRSQALGNHGATPEDGHHEQPTPCPQRTHQGEEALRQNKGNAGALVKAREEDRQERCKAQQGSGNVQVSTAVEANALLYGSGIDDERVVFHAANFSPFAFQSSPRPISSVTNPGTNYPKASTQDRNGLRFGDTLDGPLDFDRRTPRGADRPRPNNKSIPTHGE